MPVDLKSLRQERAQLVATARDLVDAAEAAKRAMTDEENAKFTELMDKDADLARRIEREEQVRQLERSLPTFGDPTPPRGEPGDTPDAMRGFRSWLQNGRMDGPDAEQFRSLSAGVNTEGGYLVAPEQFAGDLIKAVDDMVFVRSLATTYMVPNAASMGRPELRADPSDADWTTELQTGSEDSTMSLGKRSLHPRPLAKRIKISAPLLRMSVIPAEELMRDRMAYKFGITEEKAFLTGNGDGKPLGVFAASNDGISTARDVSTGNTTTAMTAENLVEVKYKLKAQYQTTAVWVFHRDGVKNLAKLKDGEGRFLWQPGLVAGQPDLLLNRPVYMSEYAPNTFTTGQYVGIFGDFRHYWIVDALDMQMTRLVELYAETNQIGFIARRELDGAPVLEEAFARVTLA